MIALASGLPSLFACATGYFSADILNDPESLALWPSDIGDVNLDADIEKQADEYSKKWLD